MKPAAYAKLRKQFERAETELMRASRKWDKLRLRIRRADAKMDKAFAAAGGEADFRDMIEPRPERAHLLTGGQWIRADDDSE